MSVHSKTCVIVECDGDCGPEKGWDEGPWHWDSEADAIAGVLGEDGFGWTQLPDGRLLCRGCSARADCAATEHQWTPWFRPSRAPHIEMRSCAHCGGAFEERFVEMGDATT